MARALLILATGVLLTFAAVVLLTPGALVAAEGFAVVLLTIVAGTAVMAVVVWRARLRERARQLDDEHLSTTTEERHRG